MKWVSFPQGGGNQKEKKRKKESMISFESSPSLLCTDLFPGLNIKLIMNVILLCQERGLSLYEDQDLKEYEDGEASTVSLRDAISLAVPDETSSGTWNLVTIIIIQGA